MAFYYGLSPKDYRFKRKSRLFGLLRKIASLEGELAIAIKAEDFERAAIIRDEIEKLEQ